MKEVKVRYSKDELEVIRQKAKKQGKTLEEYQKDLSLKARVKIIVNP